MSESQSALFENEGINQPDHVGKEAVKRIQALRKKKKSHLQLIDGILNNDKIALSQSITLIESQNPAHQQQAHDIIQACLPHANQSVRIGITGVPGVGKSTFIEAFGLHLLQLGKKVAVLAIDPSSSISKGSILGDKTRMEDLVKEENAFIRPSASGASLGGVARKTRETIILCEAAGFDTILIETVGVGQSETAVHSMTDFFLLLNLAGAGDELQGIKRGVMEMADAVVINKADGDNMERARIAKLEVNRALHLFPAKESGWQPKVRTASAYYKQGIDKVWMMIDDYFDMTKNNGFFEKNRISQNAYWLKEALQEHLLNSFYQNEEVQKHIAATKSALEANTKSPFALANELINLYKKSISKTTK